MFKRKVYDRLLEWKKNYAGQYACLLEGARRVGKTTIAEAFAQNEYESYIKIDFSDISEDMLDIFRDISKLNIFFLRLQAETGVSLIEGKSVIIFDEIQLFPRARQAIKHLVKDGRYHYIETGSLISIKKNVKNILIPSEEMKIPVYPMDYEEFIWAVGGSSELLKELTEVGRPIGNSTNRTLMRDFRIYMAVGGMPQAVDAYLRTNNLEETDRVKREIIRLYKEDLNKIDSSGRLADIYESIPSQLALKRRRFSIASATGKRKTSKDEERFFDLIDSKMVLPCYHVTKPELSLSQTREVDSYKLYCSDVGLFTTMIFSSNQLVGENIYKKLLGDKLEADLGYLYENAVAQILVSNGKRLYYHTWQKENSTHYFEIDFLTVSGNKIIPIEVKSSGTKQHASIDAFVSKYSKVTGRRFLFSQKDFVKEGMLECCPIYAVPFLMNTL